MKRAVVLFLLLPWLLGGVSTVKFAPLYIGDRLFRVEVADTDSARARGLMFRRTLGEDQGLILAWADDDLRTIWMKNCYIHLDLIFLNQRRQVVAIFANVPPCATEPCATYSVPIPVRYVLEICGGRARELGLKVGDPLLFSID